MTEKKAALLALLDRRRDKEALCLLEEDPALIDEEVITAALDHGCVRVIRFLRGRGAITMEGRAAREERRLSEANAKIAAFDREMAEIEKLLDL